VISAVELPTSALSIVAVFPSDQLAPLLIMLIVGVDEPSVTTSTIVPEDEPPVTLTPLYVPGVPPVPPDIVPICEIPLDLDS